MNERDMKFFRPLWIRVLVTGIVVVWCGVEIFGSHDGMWITITAAGALYCVWNFFLKFPKDVPAAATPAPPASDPPVKQP